MSSLNKIYKNLAEEKSKPSITDEIDFKETAYNEIKKLFENSVFINYTNSEFIEFKNSYDNLKDLTKLYKKTIEFRHNIAHNISSVYENYLSISELSGSEIIYANWYAYFMILVFVDNILIDKFKKYQEKYCRIKLT